MAPSLPAAPAIRPHSSSRREPAEGAPQGREPVTRAGSLVVSSNDEELERPDESAPASSLAEASPQAQPGRVEGSFPLPGSFPIVRHNLDYRELVPPRLKVPRSRPALSGASRAGLRAGAAALVLGLLVAGGGYGGWVVTRDVAWPSPQSWTWPARDSWAWTWPDGWAVTVDWPWTGAEQPAPPEEFVRPVLAQEEPDAREKSDVLEEPDALDELLLRSRAVRGLLPTQMHEFEQGAQLGARARPLAAPAGEHARDIGEAVQNAADRAPGPRAVNGLQVFIHHAAADSEGDARARDLASRLASVGVEVGGVRSIAVPIEELEIRYFFEQDRAATEALGRSLIDIADLSEPPELRDLSRFATKPDPGSVEIWLAR